MPPKRNQKELKPAHWEDAEEPETKKNKVDLLLLGVLLLRVLLELT